VSNTDILTSITHLFKQRTGGDPESASQAPGRVEIIGNHTDYNEGFVISVALDMKIYIAGRPRDDFTATVYSGDFDEEYAFDVRDPQRDGNWSDYVKGVVWELNKRDLQLRGFDIIIHSTLPVGIGLSSSAALEVATALFIQQLYPYEIGKFELAKMCRSAENNFVGMNCGILDQFSSVFGRKNAVLFLDCRTEEYEVIPFGREDVCVLICNSMEKHELVSSQYNARREECFRAADFFRTMYPEVSMLRDVSTEMFEQHKSSLEPESQKRARHVVYENQRVLQGREAFKDGDIGMIGKLMDKSHKSSKDWFENSTENLDLLQSIAQNEEGVIGAKLSGGGFGGCIVAVVSQEKTDNAKKALEEKYRLETGIEPDIYFADIADGAGIIQL
jgi:galactokinase